MYAPPYWYERGSSGPSSGAEVIVFYARRWNKVDEPHVLPCTYQNRRPHQRGRGIRPAGNNPGTRYYSGSFPIRLKKRRGRRKYLGKKTVWTSPARNVDFGDYFEEIGLSVEELMAEIPPFHRRRRRRVLGWRKECLTNTPRAENFLWI